MIFDGKKFANEWLEGLKKVRKNYGALHLGALAVGEDPASASFLKEKQKAAQSLGIDFRLFKFPQDISAQKLRKEAVRIGRMKAVQGLLIQLPLPQTAGQNTQYVLNAIPQEKDVDALSQKTLGAFFVGRSSVLPPTVEALKRVLESQSIDMKNARAVVVGAGRLVGKPIVTWLMQQGSAVCAVSRPGNDLKEFSVHADILITGVGKPGLIQKDMVKRGAAVVDFGFSRAERGYGSAERSYGKIGDHVAGDVDKSVAERAGFFTPVPGGMGPVTVAALMANFLTLVQFQK